MSVFSPIAHPSDAKALTIWQRIQRDLAARKARQAACRALEDDRRVREALIGVPFAKRRAAQKRGVAK